MSAPEAELQKLSLQDVAGEAASVCKTCGVEICTAASQPKHQLIADLIGVCIACFDAQNEGKDGEGSFFEPLVSEEKLKFQTCILCGAPGAAWSGPLMDQVTTFCYKHAMEFAETMSASGVSIVEQAFERAEAEFDQQCILAEIHRDMRYISGWCGEEHEEEQEEEPERAYGYNVQAYLQASDAQSAPQAPSALHANAESEPDYEPETKKRRHE